MNYLESVAEKIKSEVASQNLPKEDTESLFLLYAVLALAKGVNVTNEDVHNAWAAWMTGLGKDHESIVEFKQLDEQTKGEDLPYTEAIREVASKYLASMNQ